MGWCRVILEILHYSYQEYVKILDVGLVGCWHILEHLTYAQATKTATIGDKEWLNFIEDIGKSAKKPKYQSAARGRRSGKSARVLQEAKSPY